MRRLEPERPGLGGRPLHYRPGDPWEASKAGDERLGWSRRPTSAPAAAGSLPNWIARDKQILTFDCYYQQSVDGSQDEKSRIRDCRLFFHLEDDSLAVVEKSTENSGITQGRVVRCDRLTSSVT